MRLERTISVGRVGIGVEFVKRLRCTKNHSFRKQLVDARAPPGVNARVVKLTVEFPSVSYREGPQGVSRLAQAIEQIGYDHIDMFDHVVMGYPIAGRPPGPYPPQMPILEALMALSYMAAVTARVTLGTEVLVLPQRHPTLVAKQVSTLDTLSGGRVRLGVGVGWQEPEYEALGEDFHTRCARMDEAVRLLRRARPHRGARGRSEGDGVRVDRAKRDRDLPGRRALRRRHDRRARSPTHEDSRRGRIAKAHC